MSEPVKEYQKRGSLLMDQDPNVKPIINVDDQGIQRNPTIEECEDWCRKNSTYTGCQFTLNTVSNTLFCEGGI